MESALPNIQVDIKVNASDGQGTGTTTADLGVIIVNMVQSMS